MTRGRAFQAEGTAGAKGLGLGVPRRPADCSGVRKEVTGMRSERWWGAFFRSL